MNYEDLYSDLQEQEKILKEKIAQMQKLFKNISKETENGDIRSLKKDLAALAEANQQQADVLELLTDAVENFDFRIYFENGDYAEQMLHYCEEMSVDVRGEYPVFEMFPYKVKFDTENQDIYLDRKKIHCMRPSSFVSTVKAGQDKLTKANFNAQTFVNELADAYDLAALKLKKAPDADIYLLSLYKFLAPMSRFRKDYDQQSFSFDLARLYAHGTDAFTAKDGRHFQFGPSRNNSKALRILDAEGNEQFLATISFYND